VQQRAVSTQKLNGVARCACAGPHVWVLASSCPGQRLKKPEGAQTAILEPTHCHSFKQVAWSNKSAPALACKQAEWAGQASQNEGLCRIFLSNGQSTGHLWMIARTQAHKAHAKGSAECGKHHDPATHCTRKSMFCWLEAASLQKHPSGQQCAFATLLLGLHRMKASGGGKA
jgi:hypothetical protein